MSYTTIRPDPQDRFVPPFGSPAVRGLTLGVPRGPDHPPHPPSQRSAHPFPRCHRGFPRQASQDPSWEPP